MIQVNLLSQKAKERIVTDKRERSTVRVYRMAIAGSVTLAIILGGIFTGLHFYKSSLAEQVDEEFSAINEDNQKGEIDELLTIQRQLSEIDRLHDDKQAFSRLLNLLHQLSAGVDLQSIRLKNSDDGIVTMVGSVPDFNVFNKFKDSLQNAIVHYGNGRDTQTGNVFKSVEVSEASTTIADGWVNFRIEAKYDLTLFESGVTEFSLVSGKAKE